MWRNTLKISARLITAVIFLSAMPDASARIVVQVADTNINAGQPGLIDVFVHKEVGDADWNVLFAQYSFSITPNAGAVGSLEFDAAQLDTEQADPGYLFSAFQPTGNFTGVPNGVSQYDGGDFTNNLADLAVIGTGNSLLARLNVTHVLPLLTPPGAADGSTYTVALIPGSDMFLDDNFNAVESIGMSGTITINGAAAVPEPGTFVALAGVFAIAGVRRWRRRGADILPAGSQVEC